MEKKSKNILRIEKWLSKIGYTLGHHGCGHWYIYDDEGDITQWYVSGEVDTRIELDVNKSFQHSCVFYLSDVEIYQIPKKGKGGTVGFKGNKNVFLQFYQRSKQPPKN